MPRVIRRQANFDAISGDLRPCSLGLLLLQHYLRLQLNPSVAIFNSEVALEALIRLLIWADVFVLTEILPYPATRLVATDIVEDSGVAVELGAASVSARSLKYGLMLFALPGSEAP